MDDEAAGLGPFGEVALVPHAREALEVRAVVAAAVVVAPEPERHRRERGAAHQLTADAGADLVALVVDDHGVEAEGRALDVAGVQRRGRVAADQAAAQVGAAADRRQVGVWRDGVVDESEPLGHQR